MGDGETTNEHRRGPWTVEHAAYAAVVLLAAGLRLYQLGLRPFSEGEAAQALAAFRFVQGNVAPAPAGTVPALFTANVAAFTLLGAADAVARWLPALAGMILVLLPYGLRHRLGRGGALAASLLLAVSPSAAFFSRALDGSILVAACGLALVVALCRYLDTRQPAALYWAAGAFGVGLCAGPAFYTLVVLFLAFGLGLWPAERLLRREAGWSSLADAWSSLRSEKGLAARAGAVAAATFALVATAFVLHPAGIGGAADLLAAWLTGFLPEAAGRPAVYPLLLLLRYELLVLVLGLVGLVAIASGGRRSRGVVGPAPGSAFPLPPFLAWWAGAALLITVASGHRPAGNLLLVVVPLALLAGYGVERAWRWVSLRSFWAEVVAVAAVALGLAAFFYLQAASYTVADRTAPVSFGGLTVSAGAAYGLLAAVALFLLVSLFIVAWLSRGPATALGGGWLALAVALGLFGFRSAWAVGVAHAADPRELLIGVTAPADVRALVTHLVELSVDEAGDAHTLPITVEASTGPVVAWYLRDFERQTVVEALTAPPGTAAAVTLAGHEAGLGQTYRGLSYPLRTSWLPWGLDWPQFVRWLLFTDGILPVVDQEVVLWVAGGLGGE